MSEVEASALAAFAGQLKAWRKSKGWSQVALAAKIGYSDSLVSGVETLDKTPTLDFASRCDDEFGAPGTFVALHVLVSREAWPSYFSPVLEAEGRATQIHEWESRDIPGLLQTEAYARSVISAGSPRLSPAEIDRKVNGRLERQQIFKKDVPIMVLDFVDSPSLAYCECNGGGMLTETPSDVMDLMNTMNLIRAAALSPRDSVDLLRQIRRELDD